MDTLCLDDMTSLRPLRLRLLPDGQTVELATPAVVAGRHSDAELRLAYPDVSRRHCRFLFEDGGWRVEDLDSLNGVFINGERMQEAALYEGDRVRLGTVTLIVTEAPVRSAGPASRVLRSIAEALTPLAG